MTRRLRRQYLTSLVGRSHILLPPTCKALFKTGIVHTLPCWHQRGVKIVMEEERESPLLAVFYSEFDNKAGPKVLYQYPQNFISPEQFDGVSDLVITGKPLSKKIVGVAAYDWFIVGYPVEISHEKYERNKLLFNVSFVFTKHAFTTPYHALLRKLGNTLESVEVTSGYLFKPETKIQVRRVLKEVLVGIHRRGEVEVRLNDSNTLGLRLFWPPAAIPAVHDSDVPVRRVAVGWGDNSNGNIQTDDWERPSWGHESHFDLALVQVMPHIDGVKFVKLISVHAEVDIAVVKRTLRALLYYNQITLVDSFLYRNVYVPTGRTTELLADAEFRRGCWEMIKRADEPRESGEEVSLSDGGGDEAGGWASNDPTQWGSSSAISSNRPPSPPNRCRLTRLFLGFTEGRNVGDVLVTDLELLERIDHRKFCSFGVTSGLLRRKFTHLCLVKKQFKETHSLAIEPPPQDFSAAQKPWLGGQETPDVVDFRKAHSAASLATTVAPAAEPIDSVAALGRRSPPLNPSGDLGERYTVAEVQSMLAGYPTEEAICCHLECDHHQLKAFVTSDGVHELIKIQGA